MLGSICQRSHSYIGLDSLQIGYVDTYANSLHNRPILYTLLKDSQLRPYVHRRRLLEMAVRAKFPFPFSSLPSRSSPFPCHLTPLPLFPPVRSFPLSLGPTSAP